MKNTKSKERLEEFKLYASNPGLQSQEPQIKAAL